MLVNERVALGLFLSYWPDDKPYSEIIQMVEDEHDDIAHWEPFEGFLGSVMLNYIEDALTMLNATYPEYKDKEC